MLAIETEGPWFWIGFNAFVLGALFVDLFVFNRKAHEVKIREALLTTGVWVLLAFAFGVGVYLLPEWGLGPQKAKEYIAGYLIEQSLSVDNLFVFVVIFTYFKVPLRYQHRLLFWGVMGALVMRGVFIFVGVELINRFHFLLYVFGGFLIFTGVKLGIQSEKEPEPHKNLILRFVRWVLPVHNSDGNGHFFLRAPNKSELSMPAGTTGRGKFFVSQLFLVLILIEATDLLFAMDSIPAVLAVSKDSFVIYTSNVFAIMGLRSLYFALAGIMGMFHFLKYGLALILTFVGVKMLIKPVSEILLDRGYVATTYEIPIELALGVIGGTLATSVLASLIHRRLSPPPSGEEKELPDVPAQIELDAPNRDEAP